MSEEAKEMDTQSLSIQLMFDNDLQKFVCFCGKQLIQNSWIPQTTFGKHS